MAEGADVQTQIRSWAAPAFIAIAGALALMLWNNQQDIIWQANARISALELTLATVSESQRIASQDRALYQQATAQRLDKMQDVLVAVGENLAALRALQQQREATGQQR